MPPMKLTHYLHGALNGMRKRLLTEQAARTFLMELVDRRRKAGHDIDGWEQDVKMLLEEFYDPEPK